MCPLSYVCCQKRQACTKHSRTVVTSFALVCTFRYCLQLCLLLSGVFSLSHLSSGVSCLFPCLQSSSLSVALVFLFLSLKVRDHGLRACLKNRCIVCNTSDVLDGVFVCFQMRSIRILPACTSMHLRTRIRVIWLGHFLLHRVFLIGNRQRVGCISGIPNAAHIFWNLLTSSE